MGILVTGGAGYIGSVLVEELVARGNDVVVVDDLRKGHAGAVVDGAVLVQAALGDPNALDDVFVRYPVDAVIHLAAYSLVGESVGTPAKYYHNNVVVTLQLLDAMIRHGVTRFVFSSTAAVYGDPDQVPISEDAPTRPTNPYGATKLAIEQALPWYDSAYGLHFASLRYFNAAGASLRFGEVHDPETHLIPNILAVAAGRADHLDLYGSDYPTPDGTCIRDYIHVNDLADAHILALKALDDGSRIYNLGSGSGFSVREVVESARKVTKKPIRLVEQPRRAGDPPRLVAASNRIQRELGWQPRFPDLDSIVGSAWRWFQDHPRGYDV